VKSGYYWFRWVTLPGQIEAGEWEVVRLDEATNVFHCGSDMESALDNCLKWGEFGPQIPTFKGWCNN
jgi:hypothetical protein